MTRREIDEFAKRVHFIISLSDFFENNDNNNKMKGNMSHTDKIRVVSL